MKLPGAILLASLFVLSGCATLSEDECLAADWYAIGYEDGADGRPVQRIAAHREACASYGITPDLEDYQAGHEEGVTTFCTARNGYHRARQGYEYKGVCPASLEAEFLDGYEPGRQVHDVSSHLKNLENERQSNNRKLDAIEKDVDEREAALTTAGVSEKQRRTIYEEIADLKEAKGELTQRNKELVEDAAEARARLRVLEERYSYYD